MKKFVWVGLFVGTTVGELLPSLWGDSSFSVSAIILSVICGGVGIWLGFKIDQSMSE